MAGVCGVPTAEIVMDVQSPTTSFPAQTMGTIVELSDVRARFTGWLRANDVVDDRVDDLSVVLSELGANAVRSTPDGADEAVVEATIDDRGVVLEVSNEVGSDVPTHVEHDWDFADPLRTGGRGLLLVSAFVDDVDVEVVGRRLVVRCTIGL